MKHIIEVPAGHTVLVTREGINLVIESHASNDGDDRVIAMTNVQDLTGTPSPIAPPKPKVHEPGAVLVNRPSTGSPLLFAVVGPNGNITTALSSTKKLTYNPEGITPFRFTVYGATTSEREEFLNNLRDWYALTITETGELINWRAKQSKQYYYIDTEGRVSGVPEYFDDTDSLGYKLGNYFPEGFLTDERLSEYKATVQKLFNKWRGLCNE